MSLFRPFSSELWVCLLAGLLVWSGTTWALQRLYRYWVAAGGSGAASGGPLATLMYGWGSLLSQSPPPSYITFAGVSGQMLSGWWLVFCVVISLGYRSSLIAHLTVQSNSEVPEGFGDLVRFDGWQWGIESWMLDGEVLQYFERSSEPVVKEVYRKMEPLLLADLLQRVLDGRFSMVGVKLRIRIILLSRYVDKYGQMPFYIGKEERTDVLSSFGWGLRKGAPFASAFLRLALRLEDAGLVNYWSEVVVAKKVKENRAKLRQDAGNLISGQEPKTETVLSLDHLQSAFYLLFVGSALALITLLAERLAHRTRKETPTN